MSNIILSSDSTLYRTFEQLISSQRLVVFVGLPGVGKSLLTQQLALMAHQAGRKVHLLQWDVARRPFATDEYVVTNYPEVDGVTHGVVRKAMGLWVRVAVGQWYHNHPGEAEMLIGEAPLIGNRLIELVQRHDDDIEPLLGSSAARFVIPIPSRELRRTIEGKREASSTNPHHEREHADAIPQVLQAAWLEVYRVAQELKITSTVTGNQIEYDPDIYQGVYSTLLKHRHGRRLPLTMRLPTDNLSACDISLQQGQLAPKKDEVRTYIAQVEQLYPNRESLDREMNSWHVA
jgi:hypothetical protein